MLTTGSRVSQTGALVVTQGDPKARISQTGVLVVSKGDPKSRISQTGALVIYKAGASFTPGGATLLPSL